MLRNAAIARGFQRIFSLLPRRQARRTSDTMNEGVGIYMEDSRWHVQWLVKIEANAELARLLSHISRLVWPETSRSTSSGCVSSLPFPSSSPA